MKTSIIYPDWVEKYRSKGHTIKKLKSGYGLYSCTSVYVKGKKPKSVQTYLGMIDEHLGFIPKTTISNHPMYLEFGLSHFIISNFKRALMRSTMSSNLTLVNLGIVLYIFDDINDFFIRSCALTYQEADTYIRYYQNISNIRIVNCRNKIDKLLISTFPNEKERNILLHGLRLCVIDKQNIENPNHSIPDAIKTIIEKAGCRYES